MMSDAALAGRPASLQDAIDAAAALIGGTRRLVVGGLDADAAAIEAAILLARRRGGIVDHAHAPAALRDLQAMREAGLIATTPLQVRALADVVLLAGLGPEQGGPDMQARLWLDRPPSLHPERPRLVLRLPMHGDGVFLLRAALAGRPLRYPDAILHAADALRQARYAVIVWSAATLDVTGIALLCGLVEDLNATTRAAGLPLPPPSGAALALQVAAWTTGLPLPLGFDRPDGAPRHDPSLRATASDIDAALWLSAGSARPAPFPPSVGVVALGPSADAAAEGNPPAVAIAVGVPGVDHDAVLFDEDSAALVHRRATHPSAAPPAAEVLARIVAALPPC